ncbi:hypothetical protein Bbelb_104300 [Branchiostoma belcheri]|nr:hypothetical protein Bbelb_104300 [Branchiostoma belcheri]
MSSQEVPAIIFLLKHPWHTITRSYQANANTVEHTDTLSVGHCYLLSKFATTTGSGTLSSLDGQIRPSRCSFLRNLNLSSADLHRLSCMFPVWDTGRKIQPAPCHLFPSYDCELLLPSSYTRVKGGRGLVCCLTQPQVHPGMLQCTRGLAGILLPVARAHPNKLGDDNCGRKNRPPCLDLSHRWSAPSSPSYYSLLGCAGMPGSITIASILRGFCYEVVHKRRRVIDDFALQLHNSSLEHVET